MYWNSLTNLTDDPVLRDANYVMLRLSWQGTKSQ